MFLKHSSVVHVYAGKTIFVSGFYTISRGIISTTEREGIEEISCKHPLEIWGTTWIHHDLEIYSTLRSM